MSVRIVLRSIYQKQRDETKIFPVGNRWPLFPLRCALHSERAHALHYIDRKGKRCRQPL